MRFTELYAENFFTIDKLTLDLADQGLVLVLGENKDAPRADSNGAGKSSLLDALCWGLWGKTIRNLEGDAVVHRFRKKDCYVRVTFEDAGRTYVVERFRKHTKHAKPNDLLLTIDGAVAAGASMAATQDFITQVLGLDFPTFQVMMPGAGIKAADLTDAKIKESLEKILQTEALADALELAKTKLKTIESQISDREASVKQNTAAIESLSNLLNSYEEKNKHFEEDQDKEIKSLNLALEVSITARDKMSNVLSAEAEVRSRLSEKSTKQNLIMADIHGITSNLQAQIEKERIIKSDLAQEKRVWTITLAGLDREAKFLQENNSCTSCKQEIPHAHKELQLSALGRRTEIEVRKWTEIEGAFNTKLTAVQVVIDEYNSKLEKKREEQVKSEEDIQRLLEVLSSMNVAKGKLAILESEVKKCEANLAKYERKPNPFEDLIRGAKVALEKHGTDLERAHTSLLSLCKEKEQYDFWVKGFSVKGIRSYMLKHVTPILNDRARYYANLLTAGETEVKFYTERTLAKGKTKEEFWIEVIHKHGGDSYEGSSKGEKSRADLIIAMTLGDLASFRAHKTISFRFLDEPFESIDAAGTDAVVSLLNDQKEKYDTIFVITHNDHFKQMFNKTIKVVKENELTTLETE